MILAFPARLSTLLQFCFIFTVSLLSNCVQVSASALTAKDATVDINITKRLCRPESGPALSLELHNAARDNNVVPYGLADEACKVMASNVEKDIQNFGLSADDILVLNRLSAELKNHQNNCHYRDWFRLSAKFCLITGFIRYRNAPSEYKDNFFGSYEPPTKTQLTELEQLPWVEINRVLAGQNPTWINTSTIFGKILSILSACENAGYYIFPCFQELNLEYFVRISTVEHFPAAVALGDVMLADGLNMTREMFFLHDLVHAYLSSNRLFKNGSFNQKDLPLMKQFSENVDCLYEARDRVETSQAGLFKAIELILFMETHETRGRGLWSFLVDNRDNMKSIAPVTKILQNFKTGKFKDLRRDYDCCANNPWLLHLAALWLTSLSEPFAEDKIIPSTKEFTSAIDASITDFIHTREKYKALEALAQQYPRNPKKIIACLSHSDDPFQTPLSQTDAEYLSSQFADCMLGTKSKLPVNIVPVLTEVLLSPKTKQWFSTQKRRRDRM